MTAPDGRAATAHWARREARDAGLIAMARAVAQAAQFAGFIWAARTLGPADFGVYAMVYVGALLAQQVAEAGWRELAMTRDDARGAALGMAGLNGLGAALAIGLIAMVGAGSAGELADAAAALGLCLALSAPLLAAASVQQALLMVDGSTARVALTQMAAEGAALAVLVVGLEIGAGLTALGLAKIAQALGLFSGSFSIGAWRAARPPRRAELRGMLGFAGAVLASRLAFYANENLTVLVVGAWLGPAAAGLYRAAGRLPGSVAELITEALRAVAWSSLRAARREAGPDSVERTSLRLIATSVAVAAPAMAGLATVTEPLIAALLGPSWIAAAPVAAALAMRRFLIVHNAVLEPVLAPAGAIGWAPRIAWVSAAVSVAGVSLLAPYGLVAAAAAQAAAGVLSAALLLAALRRWAGLSPRRVLAAIWPSLAASACMAPAAGLALAAAGPAGPGPALAAAVATGVAVYALLLGALSPSLRATLLGAMRGRPR